MPARAPARRKHDLVCRPVHPNAGLEAIYQRKIVALVDEMAASTKWWLTAAYRQNTPEIAQDESPAAAMRRAIAKLRQRWFKRFDQAAKELGAWFGQAAAKRSDTALKSILKKGGFSVEFKMSPAMNDIMQATIGQQVSLIKSIPQAYLTNVEGLVMRSVQTGRDIGGLTKALQDEFGVTRRRAATIARDQNNKATSAMTRARQDELGIVEAIWQHSGGGHHPRPEHVAASGKKYDVRKGMLIDGEYIFPGEKINCRCVSKSVIPGFG